ncbi:16756_t:CDS:2, partial [Funneliformis mosseae]
LEEFHGPLEDDPGVILPKYGEMGVKKIMFTGEGLPLFPKVSPQQLHEIFVKNPANTDQCPCLEQTPYRLEKKDLKYSSESGNMKLVLPLARRAVWKAES